MRKIPIKNYFILGTILFISCFVALYLMNFFKNEKISNENYFFKKLNYTEIETYITENPDVIIYFASNEFKNSKFEKHFKKLIIKNNLNNQVIYVNKDEFNNFSFNEFVSKYWNDSKQLEYLDYIIIVDNQKIVEMISILPEQNDMSYIKKILKENEVI